MKAALLLICLLGSVTAYQVWELPTIVAIGNEKLYITVAIYSDHVKPVCFGRSMILQGTNAEGFSEYKVVCDYGTAEIAIKKIPDGAYLIDRYSCYVAESVYYNTN